MKCIDSPLYLLPFTRGDNFFAFMKCIDSPLYLLRLQEETTCVKSSMFFWVTNSSGRRSTVVDKN